MKHKERGSFTLEAIVVSLILSGIIALYFSLTFYTTDARQLGAAKKYALQSAMWQGGLTSSIITDVKNMLASSGLDPNQVIVTSPQGLNPHLPYGSKIEINITVTTAPAGGLDNSGQPTSKTHTLKAQGFTLSQYRP